METRMSVGIGIFLLLFSLTFIAATPCRAYEADAGNRAANFSGFDNVNRQTVELEDHLGQWVYVNFWATW